MRVQRQTKPSLRCSTTQLNRITIIIPTMPQIATTTTQRNQVIISAAEFSLDTAYGSVKPALGERDLNDIIRDAKDEKASPKSSSTTKTSTLSATSKDKNQR